MSSSEIKSSAIAIPEKYRKAYQEAMMAERAAVLQIGTASLEHKRFLDKKESDALEAKKAQDRATREGLIALGLDPDEKGRHFHVWADGGVTELIEGKHVTPQMPQPKRW